MKIIDRWGMELAEVGGDSLRHACLSEKNLRNANFACADVQSADFEDSDLRDADLHGADLTGARLCGANLSGANLSGTVGIPGAADTLARSFAYVRGGLECYRVFGETFFEPPGHWDIRPGSSICEVVNWNRSDSCGCGVSFGTLEYVIARFLHRHIWLCRVEPRDLAGIVVPLDFEGAARCERLTIVRKLSRRSILRRLVAERKRKTEVTI